MIWSIRSRGLAATAVVGGVVSLGLGLGAGPQSAAAATPRSWVAYVVNRGAVVPVSLTTGKVGKAIKAPAGISDDEIAITPNGAEAYVVGVDASGQGWVTPIATATNTPGVPIAVGLSPTSIAISPDGSVAYVDNSGDGTITPIDTATNTAENPLTVFSTGSGGGELALSPDGQTAYVGTYSAVVPFNLSTDTAGSPIPACAGVTGLALTPNGSEAYASSEFCGEVTPINLATDTPGSGVTLDQTGTFAVAVTPNGTTALASGSNFTGGAHDVVTPVTTTSNVAGAPISIGGSGDPLGIAVSPDGSHAYVTDFGGGTIDSVALSSGSVGIPIPVGPKPIGIAITPDQAPVAHLTVTPARAGVASSFNASGSTVAYGTIAQYHWKFGDGKTASTSAPTASHVYAKAGRYTASVTEVSSGFTSTSRVFTGQTMSRNGGPSAIAKSTITVPA